MLRTNPSSLRGKLTTLIVSLFLFTLTLGNLNTAIIPSAQANDEEPCIQDANGSCLEEEPEEREEPCVPDANGACPEDEPEPGCDNPLECPPEACDPEVDQDCPPEEECNPANCPQQAPAKVCDIEGNVFQILELPTLADAVAHVNADAPDFDDFVIDDLDVSETNNTEDCAPQPNVGDDPDPVDVCHVEGNDFTILNDLSQAEVDMHIPGHGEDFVIDNNDADDTNDTEDCRPKDCIPDPDLLCPQPVKICHVNGFNQYEVLEIPEDELDDHLMNHAKDFEIDDNDNNPNNDTSDCQPQVGWGGGGGNGGDPGDECIDFDPEGAPCDPNDDCDPNDPNCDLGGGGGNGGDCPAGCPDGDPGDGDGGDPGDGDGGEPGDGDGGDDIDLSGGSDCPANDFRDYGMVSGPDYDRLVTTWIRCEDIAHGLADNNAFFSPEDTIQYSHFVKMLMRASDLAQYQHILGSDVTQYFDLAVEKGILAEADRANLDNRITEKQAQEMTVKVLGEAMSFEANREDGLLGRKTAASVLFDLFAQ